ncbi:kinase-like domain, phloem protein 2-like protein [Tanacetum coccineum]
MSSPNHDDFVHLKIPLQIILEATNKFNKKNFRGGGDFDKKYKGQLLWSGELIKIDVRRFNKERNDREERFWMEISMLSSLKHRNLVSLVGFCDENDEKIIIIKFETRGSLSLYLSDSTLLTWVRRLKISVGIGHALSYIHYDETRDFSVIHRYICSDNVLLNDDWEPKLFFFYFSMKIEASQRHQSFHSDKLLYHDGYGDPTYLETKSVNHKSDLYTFGILMFALLCGREAVIDDNGQDNKYLASVAVAHYREKKLDEIIDRDLWNQMDSQSLIIFAEIAYDCLNEERSKRPNIGEIVSRLEKALEFQLEHYNAMSKEFAHLKVPLEIILSATNNFSEEKVIAENSFEQRYEEQLLWSGELIDIRVRRLINRERVFWMEISLLSTLKHKNLVSLVGFCDANDEKVIIYKREARRSLSNYLSDPMLLTWVRRLEICVSLAHALSYIHYDEARNFSVIHRMLCSSLILLNNDWEPKLFWFDYSMKITASQRHHSFHTNRPVYVDGFGDPTYIDTKTVSHKSDICPLPS